MLESYFKPSARPMYAYGAVAISAVGGLHVLLAALILSGDEADGCIAVDAYLRAFGHIRWLAVAALLLCAGSAAFGLATKRFSGMSRMIWLLPQQIMLSIVVIGVIHAIIEQHYADLIYRSWRFILADQSPALGIFYIHASGIVRRSRDA